MSGRRARLALMALAAAATGCSALTPFPTGPLASKPGQPDGPRIAICFNPLKTDAEKVQGLGQAECIGDTVAERVDTDYRMDDCPLLTPGRATFVCRSK
ncbi:MAG TPA: hypothetical protein VMB84_04460 [Stellaceae bacterium]|nr:hypothetical protein [Stellaceae bacterium]